MFQRIDLRQFKCFDVLKLPLNPLTLLTGLNASGKSSVLQAFALLHQTVREHEWSSRLVLNGNAVNLGTAGDVISQVTGARTCGIGLLDGEIEYQWKFTADRSEMSLAVESVTIGSQTFQNEDDNLFLHELLPAEPDGSSRFGTLHAELPSRLNSLTYLTAERIGPRDTYPLEELLYAPVVGPKGEHAVSILYAGDDQIVLDGLSIDGKPPTRLKQVGARMDQFFPGCELDVSRIARANSVALGIRTSHDTDFHRPGHTGFGITQVLPIVVAALSAAREDLLLIENPEVHLHPAGQAIMGEFLAEVASSGVQVVLETHSDHVLNGVRRAVKRQTIPADDTAIHFFRPRHEAEADGCAQVQSPQMHSDGSIDSWPEGFFDQFDKDMSFFAGWS